MSPYLRFLRVGKEKETGFYIDAVFAAYPVSFHRGLEDTCCNPVMSAVFSDRFLPV